MNGWDFSQKSTVLTCLPYTQDDRNGYNITKSVDLSVFLCCFVLWRKKNICKFRLHFRKSVQTFHAKVVCPAFLDRPPSEAAFLAEPFLWLQRCRYWGLRKASICLEKSHSCVSNSIVYSHSEKFIFSLTSSCN